MTWTDWRDHGMEAQFNRVSPGPKPSRRLNFG